MGAAQVSSVRVPMGAAWRTKPEGNQREHPLAVWRRGEAQKKAMWPWLRQHAPPKLPAVITLTRISMGTLDTDNLQSALKRIRDSVAEWCGCGDSPSDPIEWEYAQQKGPRGEQTILIEWRSADAK